MIYRRESMRKCKWIICVLLVMLCGCSIQQDKQEECKVKVDNEEIFISGKMSDFDVKDMTCQEDDNGYFYSKEGLDIYTNDAQIIEKIEISKSDYQLSNGDAVGMNADEFKKDKEFVRENEILDNNDQLIEGRYGIVYESINIKVEYVFEKDILKTITISQIFDF